MEYGGLRTDVLKLKQGYELGRWLDVWETLASASTTPKRLASRRVFPQSPISPAHSPAIQVVPRYHNHIYISQGCVRIQQVHVDTSSSRFLNRSPGLPARFGHFLCADGLCVRI